MSKFIVLRRTEAEVRIFGGEVYIDIDGKNAGIVRMQNLAFDLPAGKHTIKMYKSHTMGTFIGFAETVIDVKEDENLYARYSAPLMVNQPGNVVIAPFESEEELDQVIRNVERSVHTDFTEQQIKIEQTKKESERNTAGLIVWIVVVPIIVGVVFWLITMSQIW